VALSQTQTNIRVVRVGRRKLVPVAELERWLDKNAHLILDQDAAA